MNGIALNNPLQLLLAAAVFGLFLSLWLMGVVLWGMIQTRRRRQLRHRLGLEAPDREPSREIYLWTGNKLASTAVPGVRHQLALTERLRLLHESTGTESPFSSFLLGGSGLIFGGFLAAYLWSGNLILGVITAFVVAGLIAFVVNRRIAQRNALFERQFLDALGMATRSLRAGHPLTGAFQMIANEMAPPVGRIFGEICQQQELGLGLDEALENAVRRYDNIDLKLFTTATVIQLRSGGNLAEMMDRLAQVIRERMRLARRARVLTAQAQFSKWILLILPLVLFVILWLLNPAYESRLVNTGLGRLLLGITAANMLLGSWVMNRIARLRY